MEGGKTASKCWPGAGQVSTLQVLTACDPRSPVPDNSVAPRQSLGCFLITRGHFPSPNHISLQVFCLHGHGFHTLDLLYGAAVLERILPSAGVCCTLAAPATLHFQALPSASGSSSRPCTGLLPQALLLVTVAMFLVRTGGKREVSAS